MARHLVPAILLATFITPIGGKIHQDTYVLGKRHDGYYHAWVYFTGKSPAPSIDTELSPLTARALIRRAERGSLSPEQAQVLDQPVSSRFLQQVEATGATLRRVSRWLNATSVRATREQLQAIARLSCIDRIAPLRRLKPVPEPVSREEIFTLPPNLAKTPLDYGPSEGALAMMNVPAVHALGYSGRGITVLMLDTGFYKEHESITQGRILAEYDFLFEDGETQNEDSRDSSLQNQRYSQHNHGTHTYSALGGYWPGRLIGPAYECSYLLAKTESIPGEYEAEEDNYVAGLEWGEALGADVVSSSLGYLKWYTYSSLDGQTAVTTKAVRWATRLGMLVVTSAGNERGDPDWGGYIIAPADADSIIAVGAVDGNGGLASFSSHGPTFDGRTKPEVVAQGVSVTCASPTGPSAYAKGSGTSLSAPLVAGSAALLLQAHPSWTPLDVRSALMSTASRADQPDNDFGWGIPDILAALDYDTEPGTLVQLLQIEEAYPNPFIASGRHNSFVLRWTTATMTAAKIDVYNLLGEHIINLYSPADITLGKGVVSWRGRDALGRMVPAGVYFIKLATDRHSAVRRVIVTR
jgi:subtilisin family serine protease